MYLMSAPAANAFSPPPVRTMTRTLVVVTELGQAVAELGERRDVERVHRLGTIECEDGDRVLAIEADGYETGTFSLRKSTISPVGAPGVKISATPWLFSSAASSAGIVPPTTTSTSLAPFSFSPFEDLRDERHVRAGQDRDADGVRVLLDRGLDDLLRSLVQTGVDDLHPCVAESPGDDLRAAIVTVQARLGDDYAYLSRHARESSREDLGRSERLGVWRSCVDEVKRGRVLARLAESWRGSIGLPAGGAGPSAHGLWAGCARAPAFEQQRDRLAARRRDCDHALPPGSLGRPCALGLGDDVGAGPGL